MAASAYPPNVVDAMIAMANKGHPMAEELREKALAYSAALIRFKVKFKAMDGPIIPDMDCLNASIAAYTCFDAALNYDDGMPRDWQTWR